MALGVVCISSTAFAHAHLVSATPAANSMAMPAPTELRLKFSEGLNLKFSKVKVTGPDHAEVKTGAPRLDAKDSALLIVPLPSALVDGSYKIEWQAVAVDGHKTTGTYSFESMQ